MEPEKIAKIQHMIERHALFLRLLIKDGIGIEADVQITVASLPGPTIKGGSVYEA